MSAFLASVRRACVNAAKKNGVLRRCARGLIYIGSRLRYVLRGGLGSLEPKTVVFESFGGKSYACSPKAIYEYMLRTERYADYRFVWIFRAPERYRFLEQNERTVLVKYKSAAADKAMRRAKYWIFNYRALDYYIPRRGQVYVQCWHGTPLKRLGYDLEHTQNSMNSTAEIRAKYRTDAKRFRYLLSPSPFASEKFTTAWNLKAMGKEGAVLELGYPRNDFLFTYTARDVERIKEKLGLSGVQKKILLYAPTWRDNQHTSGVGYTFDSPVDFGALQEALGEEYVLLFRAHYLVANSFDFAAYKGFVYDVSRVDDVNELYVIADMLITDYSSVFFDYANLNRPMIFYMYDLDQYANELRGFYLNLEELPGRIVRTEEELIDAVHAAEGTRPDHTVFNRRFNPFEDGASAERVTEVIF